MSLEDKYQNLQRILKQLGKVLIAYSGGVDSTFLLKAAVDALSPANVIAVIAQSPSLPNSQYQNALDIAKNIGAAVRTIQTDELSNPVYSANKADRCFHCKAKLLSILTDLAKKENVPYVLVGSNYDDKDDYRPGSRAVKAFDAKTPLADAKLTKNDIRQLSKRLNLPTADMPASPCLASRVVYGLQITQQRLNQVEQAEEFLKQLGLIEFRVRHHDTIARIEVHPENFPLVTAEPARSKIIDKLKSLGFEFVTVDLQGFHSGSLNRLLDEDEKKKNL